jgi:hypothetical protein
MLMAAPQAAAEVGPVHMLGDDMLLLYMEQLSDICSDTLQNAVCCVVCPLHW